MSIAISVESDEEPKLLVGYGAKNEPGAAPRRTRRGVPVDADRDPEAVSAAGAVRAKPPVRKLAKTLGVDLASVPATGPSGTVTRADVVAARPVADEPSLVSEPRPSTVERHPVPGCAKGHRGSDGRLGLQRPHVTELVSVYVTETLALRDRVQVRREFRDVRLTPLAFVARAYVMAIARTPWANGTRARTSP